jgi:hypothetical protein
MLKDKTCLSYWFPRIKDLPGIRTPRTEIVFDAPIKALFFMLENPEHEEQNKLEDQRQEFFVKLKAAADRIGYPCFLRTGHTSNKHYWKNTCYLEKQEDIPFHVAQLVEFSECADMMGLPYAVWVIRELLPTEPAFTAFSGQMPICREFRAFGRDGKTECIHPYWPEGSLENQVKTDHHWRTKLRKMSMLDAKTDEGLRAATAEVTAALGGYWSVDWLWTNNGWYLTDMAEGEKSFHWAGCKFNKCD